MLHSMLECTISLGLASADVEGLIINVTHTDVKALLFLWLPNTYIKALLFFRRPPTYVKALIFIFSMTVGFSRYIK